MHVRTPLSMPAAPQVKAVLDEILDKIPETFNMAEIMAKAAEKTPYVVVAFQECERMNALTSELRRSLKELSLGLKASWPQKGWRGGREVEAGSGVMAEPFCPQGELTITTDMEDLSTALFYDTVPETWMARAYPSMMGLAAWYADLLLRVRVRLGLGSLCGTRASPRPSGQNPRHHCAHWLASVSPCIPCEQRRPGQDAS